MPGHVAPSLHAGWQAMENLLVTTGLENITDVDYRNHGSGNNEPGFNAILGLNPKSEVEKSIVWR